MTQQTPSCASSMGKATATVAGWTLPQTPLFGTSSAAPGAEQTHASACALRHFDVSHHTAFYRQSAALKQHLTVYVKD